MVTGGVTRRPREKNVLDLESGVREGQEGRGNDPLEVCW